MYIHASKELTHAMSGIVINGKPDENDPDIAGQDCAFESACDSERVSNFNGVWAYGPAYTDDKTMTNGKITDITCPKCIRIVFDLVNPVHRDRLLELGLIKDLPKE